MLVDKINFGLVLNNHFNFYRFEETFSYWLVERISVFLCFSLVNQRHTSGITVYNRAVTNIENLCGPCIAAIAGLFYLIALYFLNRMDIDIKGMGVFPRMALLSHLALNEQQHRRMVQNNSWNLARMPSHYHLLQHFSRKANDLCSERT